MQVVIRRPAFIQVVDTQPAFLQVVVRRPAFRQVVVRRPASLQVVVRRPAFLPSPSRSSAGDLFLDRLATHDLLFALAHVGRPLTTRMTVEIKQVAQCQPALPD
jgi:hypothetical protein